MIAYWLTKTRRRGYDCSDFAAGVLGCPVEAVSGALATRGGWQRLNVPAAPCAVLLRRNSAPPHVGIYINGGVLHLGERVALFQPMHVIERDYNRIGFYAYRNCNN